MSAPNTPIVYLPQKTQDALIEYFKQTRQASFLLPQLRNRFQYIDQEYIRENRLVLEDIKATQANKMGNKRKIADIVIPIVEPQIETAHSYLTSLFLTGYPMFGVVSDRENEDAALQMETIIENQSMRPEAPWAQQFSKFFRDGLKYNFSAIEVDWCSEKVWGLQTDTTTGTGASKAKEEIWAGNCIKRLDPYNTLFDPRVELTKQHTHAEFSGYSEMYNRVGLMQKIMSLPMKMNYTKAFQDGGSSTPNITDLYFIPTVFTENFNYASMAGLMDWTSWAQGGVRNVKDIRIQFKNLYTLVTRYCRIVPEEFGIKVPNAGQVQIWKFLTVNDQVLVYAERQTNIHNMLPIFFGQPMEDGLNLQTKSLAQKMIPFQDLASAHANAHLAARRKAVGDRMFYDPSRIDKKDIDNDNPAARIPVRPSAYGQPIEKAFAVVPFRYDESRGVMADVREVGTFADYVSGQNKAQQGQFTKGNRTKAEYEDINQASSGRQATMGILMENQVMMPVKHVVKTNILQYQAPTNLYSMSQQKQVQIKPQDIRAKALVFKVSDGVLPSEKLMDSDTLSVAIQTFATSQELQMEYDVPDMIVHMIKMHGVDLTQFKRTQDEIKQEQDAQALAATQQAVAQGAAKGTAAGATQAAVAGPQPQPQVAR